MYNFADTSKGISTTDILILAFIQKLIGGKYMNCSDTIYQYWKSYIVWRNGDLRVLTADLADALLEKAIDAHDNKMIEALEIYFG